MNKIPKHILPVIVFAQFAGTSLWFAGNAILPQIQQTWALPKDSIAQVTSSVMLGFIGGTLIFALTSLADRFNASKVFFLSAVLGALFNSAVLFTGESFGALLLFRFLTGICIAGIYPVGMKIASDWFDGRLGKALGYLVGALVIGSAFPHLLNHFGAGYDWRPVLVGTSVLGISGGLLMYFLVGEGPARVKSTSFSPKEAFKVFQKKEFRWAAFGYFGHMWELYTFWAFTPLVLSYYSETQSINLPISLWTFIIMALGMIGCVLGGIVSIRKGSAKVAFGFLLASGILCLLSPMFFQLPPSVFLVLLCFWGFVVIGDSAQFSSLNAQKAPIELKGTALTIAVSVGFFLTIPSIQLLQLLTNYLGVEWLLFTLAIGPVLGLLATKKLIDNP
ncbi:MAG: MFS transporter [Roseivirga sp.]|uniref:MFS transporter n=1 Tax=Roseivirga sp. TaxID=1964215 RepID=UPI001B111BC1|nr:MFS transporter [Roseivirga sp.]MBO6494626.1 MFS transporter [Roseivirga sp.]